MKLSLYHSLSESRLAKGGKKKAALVHINARVIHMIFARVNSLAWCQSENLECITPSFSTTPTIPAHPHSRKLHHQSSWEVLKCREWESQLYYLLIKKNRLHRDTEFNQPRENLKENVGTLAFPGLRAKSSHRATFRLRNFHLL